MKCSCLPNGIDDTKNEDWEGTVDGERATMLLSTAPLLFLQRLKENQGSAKKQKMCSRSRKRWEKNTRFCQKTSSMIHDERFEHSNFKSKLWIGNSWAEEKPRILYFLDTAVLFRCLCNMGSCWHLIWHTFRRTGISQHPYMLKNNW